MQWLHAHVPSEQTGLRRLCSAALQGPAAAQHACAHACAVAHFRTSAALSRNVRRPATVSVQVFSTDQQLAFELQGSSFKLVVGTLQVSRVHQHA
jgi:hypothetical protein